MIDRYEVKEVSEVFSERTRLQKFLEVERALLQVLEAEGRVPKGTLAAYQNVEIRPDRVREIEATTKHDIIAFCTSITEQVDPKFQRFFHFGVTSSDVLDTATSLQLRDAIKLVSASLQGLTDALAVRIKDTSDLLCMGRSHGMSAEPMVFAQKFLSYQAELKRRLRDYQDVVAQELTGQASGAVGNYTVLTPEIEEKVVGALGLRVESVSTQVIPRDRLARIIQLGALTAAALERLAVEIRHLHHSDIAELHEGFKPGQKGSSTMPHKKNPIASENITGLSRLIRSHAGIALENTVLWHERDISHSSNERMMLPDHFGILVYMIKRMADTVQGLEIHREAIELKVTKNFQCFSSAVLHQLIEQVQMSREELYALVQVSSFQAVSLEDMISRVKKGMADQGVKADVRLDASALRAHYFKQFQQIMARV